MSIENEKREVFVKTFFYTALGISAIGGAIYATYSLLKGTVKNKKKQEKEITVRIFKESTGDSLDVDVPMDATIGDVIIGLSEEGFLDRDNWISSTTLYGLDGSGYTDRKKTIEDCGWENGMSILAVSEKNVENKISLSIENATTNQRIVMLFDSNQTIYEIITSLYKEKFLNIPPSHESIPNSV